MEASSESTRRVNLGGLRIEVLADKHDPKWYRQRAAFEEKASPLYRLIREEGFTTFVDVGANVGLISILARRASPGLRIVAIEPDPRLVPLLERNLDSHGVADADVFEAIAGEVDDPRAEFGLNPESTLDNRVVARGWRRAKVPMMRLDSILGRLGLDEKVFIKIDTQGYEAQVLRGLEPWLANRRDWTIKLEFAPDWLRSQGTDPVALLDYIGTRFRIAELPGRVGFATAELDALFASPIVPEQHQGFLDYVVSLNRDDLGWVDLLLRRSGP